MSEKEQDKALKGKDTNRLRFRHDKEAWQVKWGFDSGDCFTVFPMLPKLPHETDIERWERSFIPLRDTGEMLCIESDVVGVLLRRILEARFDASLDHCRDDALFNREQRFDWYSNNVYTVAACREICSLLRTAAGKLTGLPDDSFSHLTETGDIATCQSGDNGWCLLTASEARRDCLLIAEYLERVAASAEKQGAVVSFSGP